MDEYEKLEAELKKVYEDYIIKFRCQVRIQPLTFLKISDLTITLALSYDVNNSFVFMLGLFGTTN